MSDTTETPKVIEAPKAAEAMKGPEPVPAPAMEVPKADDSEKAMGVKDVAVNPEGMAQAKEASEKGDDNGPDMNPSFFVEPGDKQRIEVDVLYYAKTGKLHSISRSSGADFSGFQFLKVAKEWFEFTIPGYDDMAAYRQRSAVYRKDADKMVIDKVQLRNYILVWHLKDWSIRDRAGNKVSLECSPDGSLTEESIKKVYKVGTPILDVVLTLFDREVLLQG
jgi:hypothetical protein